MSFIIQAQQRVISAVLSLSAQSQMLHFIHQGGQRLGHMKAHQRARLQSFATQFGMATTHDLACLEARLELFRVMLVQVQDQSSSK